VYDISAESRRVTPGIEVPDTEIVFVGHGIIAPEYGWDDYKGLDVRGKTLVMLINDPPVVTSEGSLDERMFRGRAMTYYGRWTYKYEIAARLGAAACLIVHETGPAGYPFAVVGASAGREQFDLRTEDGNRGRAAVEAWMTWDFSRQLFAAAGLDLAALKAAAARPDFRPVVVPARARYSVKNTLRDVRSRNVAALLPGRDPSLKDEYVVLTSHWDHLGRDPRREGDQIFNGATDNASGTAILLDVAARLAALPPAGRPRRSLLFLSVTAEEMGLLGARHYAANPLYPLARTVANVNLDGANHLAPTRDIEVIGWGATTIEDTAAEVARALGRTLTPDTQPEKGSYYRSDHFEFAKAGVPAFYSKAGRQPIDRPADYIDQKRAEYVSRHYHKVSDEVTTDWDFSATAQDSDFLFELSRRLGDADDWPRWREGSEFKARRDAMLQ
jgi:Zn-dependent M28 family amino/carboxypeptidase